MPHYRVTKNTDNEGGNMEQSISFSDVPRPVSAVRLTLSGEELVFLTLAYWNNVDGFDSAWPIREDISDCLHGAFQDAFGSQLDVDLVRDAGADTGSSVVRAKALCRHLGLLAR